MALLVVTAGNPKRATGGAHGHADAPASRGTGDAARATTGARSTTTTTLDPVHTGATALTSTQAATVPTTAPPAPSLQPALEPATATTTTTTPTVAPTTTTTVASPPVGAGSHEGVIEPPAQRSSSVGFTGTGAMNISVLWSGSTYLTMQVSCPSGSQNVGGSSAMEATLPDASGSCLATVSEPASESTALTYTITIGPSGG
jgi:hypothetical protein